MQKQELFDHEEQEKYNGQASAEKILQKLYETYGAQRNESVDECRPVALTARASDSKSEGWGFESLLACQLKRGRMHD